MTEEIPLEIMAIFVADVNETADILARHVNIICLEAWKSNYP